MKNSSFCSHPPPFSAVAAAAFQTGPWECCTPTCQTPSPSPAPPVPAPGWPRLLPTSVWLPWAIPPSPPPRPKEVSARSPAWTSNVKTSLVSSASTPPPSKATNPLAVSSYSRAPKGARPPRSSFSLSITCNFQFSRTP